MNEAIPTIERNSEEPFAVRNIQPVFNCQAAQEKKKQEIAQILYEISSKYE